MTLRGRGVSRFLQRRVRKKIWLKQFLPQYPMEILIRFCLVCMTRARARDWFPAKRQARDTALNNSCRMVPAVVNERRRNAIRGRVL